MDLWWWLYLPNGGYFLLQPMDSIGGCGLMCGYSCLGLLVVIVFWWPNNGGYVWSIVLDFLLQPVGFISGEWYLQAVKLAVFVVENVSFLWTYKLWI